jgi:hypothetical protein
MPDDTIHIDIKGMDELMRKMDKFPAEIKQTMEAAGREAAVDVILKTQGVQKYPPATAANSPPAPYYIRGRGMMYASRLKATSERHGTQAGGQVSGSWTVDPKDFKTTITAHASYAHWLIGEQQAGAMGRIGWRKIIEVAKERQADITRIYNLWVERLLKQIGLK